MIYELRRYQIAPGRVRDYIGIAKDVGRKIRGDRYGKLEGHWRTLSGNADQVVHLWSFDDMMERERLRQLLGTDQRWATEFLSLLEPLVRVQDNQLMRAVGTAVLEVPRARDSVFELRTDRMRVPLAPEMVGQLIAACPDEHATKLGTWQTTIGRLNEVVHLWELADAAALVRAQRARNEDQAWQAFRRSFLEESTTELLTASELHLEG